MWKVWSPCMKAALCSPGPSQQPIVGKEAIRTFYARLILTGINFDLGDQRPAIISGDLALTSTRLPNGNVTAEVARRQVDGSWLWVIDQPAIAVTEDYS
jgi:hypothetical protein